MRAMSLILCHLQAESEQAERNDSRRGQHIISCHCCYL